MAIILKNVAKKYGKKPTETTALSGVDLTIEQGIVAVVLGPSGSGKSTLLNVMSGLDRFDEGEIRIDDYDIGHMDEKALTLFRRNHLGFVFQQFNLLQTLTVKENILIGAHLVDNPMDTDNLIKKVGLEAHKDKYPFQLSGGEQQRVSIARALVKKPKILFCDEPTGSLDETTAKSILGLLQALNKDFKTTIILITHNESIAHLANQIIKMNSGNIVDIKENNPVDAKDIHWN